MFHCPKCNHPIGELGAGGVLVSVCAACQYKFEALRGTLAGRSSRQVTLQRKTPRHGGTYEREYELRVQNPTRGLQVLAVRTPGKEDRITVRKGDTLLVVHSLRDDAREELLSITNETTGAHFDLSDPGEKSAGMATVLALVLGVIVALGFLTNDFPLSVSAFAFVAVAGASAWFFRRTFAPTHRLEPDQHAELSASQSWLVKKSQLLELHHQAAGDAEQKQQLRERLRQLQEKMLSVGLDVYRERLGTIDRAIRTLDTQLDLDHQLMDGYDKSIKMIEIEYETGLATEELDVEVGVHMTTKLDELRLLQEQHAELSRQLEANGEVDRLLGAGPREAVGEVVG